MNKLRSIAVALTGSALASTLLVAPMSTATAVSATAGLPTTAASKTYDFSVWESDWTDRMAGSYDAKGRRCSAPYADQRSVSNGAITLKVSKETNSSIIAAVKSACVTSLKSKGNSASVKNLGKKFDTYKPVYRNAMLSTQGTYTVGTGTVAARVKFSSARGSHGGIWLQSVGGSEIDFIESYGYGKAITSVVHTRKSNGTMKENKLYSKKQKKSWFNKYHVFSVSWTNTKLTFRIDGKVVKTKSLATSGPYFLVMSQLSSDWELNKMPSSISKGKSSAAMSVDWIKVWATS